MSQDVRESSTAGQETKQNRPRISETISNKATKLAKNIRNLFGGKKDGNNPPVGVDDALRRVAQGEDSSATDAGQQPEQSGRHREKNQRLIDRFRRPKNDEKHRAQPPETQGRHGEVATTQESQSEAASVSLKQRGPDATALADLRDVGADKYGSSLVDSHHTKDIQSSDAHEDAQREAYRELNAKIEAKLVDPSAITEAMCEELGVSPDVGKVPDRFDDIAAQVTAEVQMFREAGHINDEEMQAIEREVATFAQLYGEVYGTENIAKAYVLIRDNARKLSYQTALSHKVFSGSDHGTKHIIDGNIKFADDMVKSLVDAGVKVSPQDRVLIHQIMIDHDLGYTAGAAQAPGGFAASKDHPLVSARFIEENEAYYVDKFGKEGYDAIFESVLQHSYPRLEYQIKNPDGVNADFIRGVTSTVDALGVTVETKTPAFFLEPDSIRVLLQMRFAAELNGGKTPQELLDKYQQDLLVIAGKEADPARRESYVNAVTNFFTQKRAEALHQYTGYVKRVRLEPIEADEATAITQDHGHDHGEISQQKYRVVVEMTPTEVYGLLGGMFGSQDANAAFMKAMKDLGLPIDQLDAYAKSIVEARATESERPDQLIVKNANARIEVSSELLEDKLEALSALSPDTEKIGKILEVFREASAVTIRSEINRMIDRLDKGEGSVAQLGSELMSIIGEKTTEAEIRQLISLFQGLNDTEKIVREEPGPEGSGATVPVTRAQESRRLLKIFMTSKEAAFLGLQDQNK